MPKLKQMQAKKVRSMLEEDAKPIKAQVAVPKEEPAMEVEMAEIGEEDNAVLIPFEYFPVETNALSEGTLLSFLATGRPVLLNGKKYVALEGIVTLE